jgi:hypothetical protein
MIRMIATRIAAVTARAMTSMNPPIDYVCVCEGERCAMPGTGNRGP